MELIDKVLLDKLTQVAVDNDRLRINSSIRI